LAASRTAEVDRHDYVGPVATDHGGDVAAQIDAVLDQTVGVGQEVDGLDSYSGGGTPLLLLADPCALVGSHGIDPGLPGGDQQVGDLLALLGPAGDG
jgi:hypothetical protein